ncbi:MAG TPA: protoporphyrinogen oxidase [Holophagaceae bacterium]|nr:protoporphyrinogen oxidase [Holophagaceae bacterium]
MKTLILGGGVTGLTAAWKLQQRGEEVEVWEAAEAPGGWVKTLPWGSGYVERGPQGVLVVPGSPVDRLFRELGLETRSPGHGKRWVGKGGRLVPVPTNPVKLLTSDLMPLSGRLRMMLEPFVPVRKDKSEEALTAFVARRLGRGVAEHLLPAMISGILAAPVELLSVDALPKLTQWEATGSLVKGMRSSGASALQVPKGGMGELPKALAARVNVRTGLRAERIAKQDGRWRVWSWEGMAEADRIVLALPAYEAAPLLGSLAPQSAEAMGAMPYTSVRLFHSRHLPLDPLRDGFGFLVHPPEGQGFLGSLVPSWIDPDSAPGGLMQLRTFIGSFNTDPAFQTWEGVEAALRRWVPELPETLEFREERADQAIPRAEMGHRRRLEQALGGLPQGIDWISNARFGPGVRDVVEGLEGWGLR